MTARDLTRYRDDKDWLKIRGREIAMVLQDPMTSLNPLKTIGAQIQEAVELHQGLKGPAAKQAVLEVLADVGIDDPERRYKQYPHEFSGGMRQRVVIAIAMACRPKNPHLRRAHHRPGCDHPGPDPGPHHNHAERSTT